MVNNSSWIETVHQRFTQTLAHPPLDLSIVTAFAAMLGVVVALDLDPGWGLRASLAVFTLALLPGYVLIAIAYPWNDGHERDQFQPSYAERAALAFGTSVGLLVLLALVPGLLGVGYTPLTTLVVIEGLLAIGIPIAVYRRKGVQRSDQFRLPLSGWMTALSDWLDHTNQSRRLLRGAMVASILIAAVSFSYVLAVPQDGERYSTMTLLSEDDSGELVTADYPSEMTIEEPAELTLEIENDRQRETTYTVVIQLERVSEDDAQAVSETEELARLRPTVGRGDTWIRQHTVTPTMVGENLRLRYYLYVGEPPDTIGPQTAQDYLHVWVDVAPQ